MRAILRGASWRCIPLLWRACSMLLMVLMVLVLVLLLVVRCWLLALSLSLALLAGWRWMLLVGQSGQMLLVLLVLASGSLLPRLLLVLLWLIVVRRRSLLLRRQRLLRCCAPLRLRLPLLEARWPSACGGVVLLVLLVLLGRTCRVEQCRKARARQVRWS